MIRKVVGALKNPVRIILYCSRRGWLNWVPDEIYLKIVYRMKVGRTLHLDNPKTFNEKLQWLKIYDRNPKYTQYVDKLAVRDYIKEKIGEEYLVPLIGAWDKFDDIDFEKLPRQFVLKCNHDSGSVIVCKNKQEFDIKTARRKLEYALKNNGYNYGREWPYKDVEAKIIAEEYMEDESGEELKDYKVMCFDGEPQLIQIHRGRFGSHTQDFYDCDWKKLPISQGIPMSDVKMQKPAFLEQMLMLSRQLSQGMPEARIDWYWVDERLIFGEITLFDGSGFDKFEPEEWDEKLGEWIVLPKAIEK